MNINILEKMNKVPGGLIIIPLLVAILINTFAPQVLSIGGPTTALFKVGSSAMMGIFLLIFGTSINIRQAGLPLYKGAVLLFLKCLAGHWRYGLRERCLARAVFSEYRPWR
ncbi:2-keto-3-deoxygluconate permease [Klebsiella pneumoniae]|uniref:2-keto-3-deoxygluconate permease n=1 Tax=Klebsiella pneumoniae TaxID=573 RepID=A0A4P0Y212_KLEPN|nr:2-keto-3-deoxygluconate permease [Klebsiella pneumoniae]